MFHYCHVQTLEALGQSAQVIMDGKKVTDRNVRYWGALKSWNFPDSFEHVFSEQAVEWFSEDIGRAWNRRRIGFEWTRFRIISWISIYKLDRDTSRTNEWTKKECFHHSWRQNLTVKYESSTILLKMTQNFRPGRTILRTNGPLLEMVLLEVSFVVNAINSHVVGSLSDVYMAVNLFLIMTICSLNLFRHKDLSTLVLYFVPNWSKFSPGFPDRDFDENYSKQPTSNFWFRSSNGNGFCSPGIIAINKFFELKTD